MGSKLYVGNLTYGVTDSELQDMFQPHGDVRSAQVIMDRDTGRSKGFGFVEMEHDQDAQSAIQALNGKEMDGRSLTVNEARPKEAGGGGRGGNGQQRQSQWRGPQRRRRRLLSDRLTISNQDADRIHAARVLRFLAERPRTAEVDRHMAGDAPGERLERLERLE